MQTKLKNLRTDLVQALKESPSPGKSKPPEAKFLAGDNKRPPSWLKIFTTVAAIAVLQFVLADAGWAGESRSKESQPAQGINLSQPDQSPGAAGPPGSVARWTVIGKTGTSARKRQPANSEKINRAGDLSWPSATANLKFTP